MDATACGGSSNSSSVSPLGEPFSANVLTICERALAAKKTELPFPFASFNPTKHDLAELPAISRDDTRGVEIFRIREHRMLALGAPPQGR